MNDLQKEHIINLRDKGISYSKIASALNISVNTVKSFCRRKNIGINPMVFDTKAQLIPSYCKHCSSEIVQTEKRKKRIFCSYACRMEWWKAHPEKITQKAVYTFTCHYCKNEFTAYGNKSRKFCSHDCYIKDRFGVSDMVNDDEAIE
jgi:transposase